MEICLEFITKTKKAESLKLSAFFKNIQIAVLKLQR